MDGSHTRRGNLCWFRLEQVSTNFVNLYFVYLGVLPLDGSNYNTCIFKVGMIAVNDGVLLRNHIPRILKKHFRQKPYYVDLLDLFNEVK